MGDAWEITPELIPLRVRRESAKTRRRRVLGCRGARSPTLVPWAVRSSGSGRAIAARGFWNAREETLGSQKWERPRARIIQVDTAGRPGSLPTGGDRKRRARDKAPLPWEASRKKWGGGAVYLQDVTEFVRMTDLTFKAQA